jgi:hypothetical protein
MSFYGYAPSRYAQSPWAAVQNIGNIASSAVLKSDELVNANKLMEENKLNNSALIDGMQQAIDQWPDEAFTQAGTSKATIKQQISSIDPKSKNTEVYQSLNSIISPVREKVSSLAGEKKTQTRQGEISQGVSSGILPRFAETEAPSATPRAVPDTSGMNLRTAEMPQRIAVPGSTPRTKEDIVSRTVESWPTGRPVPTMTELEEEPRVATAPSALDLEKMKLAGRREGRLQDMTDYQAERIKIAWANVALRKRNMDVGTQKEINDLVMKAQDYLIQSGKVQFQQLPPLFDSFGQPTGNQWTEEQKAMADAYLKAYDEGVTTLMNQGKMTALESEKGTQYRFPGGLASPAAAVPGAAPGPAPAPAQPKPQSDPLGLF